MNHIHRDALLNARSLAARYGYKLERPVVYTQGVALDARLELAEVDPEYPDPLNDIRRIGSPYMNDIDGVFDADDGTANYAGIIWASRIEKHPAGAALLMKTADRFLELGNDGMPAVLDRDYRVEDMFFAGTVLNRATAATGMSAYSDVASEFMLQCVDKIQQENGLYLHCLSSPYFWGRGNGFAALGFSETLKNASEEFAQPLLEAYQKHMLGLQNFQSPSTGMWRQVIDREDAYEEMSATCMIGIAMATGIRFGWLPREPWGEALARAWKGVSERITPNGEVRGVCVGTGPLSNLDDYLVRESVDGFDDRGGAMALWFAVTMLKSGI